MIYLKSFSLPSLDEEEFNNLTPRAYPYGIFPFKELRDIHFQPITVFYGSNGSGKSTLLNLIAEKLKLPRNTLFNTSTKFDQYVDRHCHFSTELDDDGLTKDIPLGSKIITSEDIFNYILTIRDENQRIEKQKVKQEQEFYNAKYGRVRFESLDDYEMIKKQNEARKKTMTRFVTDRVGHNIDQFSNGETALSYFDRVFEPNKLYLLDEPENSLSPKFQLQLSQLILQCERYLGCQFIIVSHSPFILSIEDAIVYDLDSVPAIPKPWYELENMIIYYKFFQEYQKSFDNDK